MSIFHFALPVGIKPVGKTGVSVEGYGAKGNFWGQSQVPEPSARAQSTLLSAIRGGRLFMNVVAAPDPGGPTTIST